MHVNGGKRPRLIRMEELQPPSLDLIRGVARVMRELRVLLKEAEQREVDRATKLVTGRVAAGVGIRRCNPSASPRATAARCGNRRR